MVLGNYYMYGEQRVDIMGDAVKYIFTKLIKVPVIILVSYAIFNAFGFVLSSMKVLGLSYVALQTAMENNFIPAAERSLIENYMTASLETDLLQNVRFTDGTTFTKKQYGEEVTVGVQAEYKIIWPLTPKEQIHGEFEGMNGSGSFGGYKTEAELEATRRELENKSKANIVIEYVVPGLKYYPDLR